MSPMDRSISRRSENENEDIEDILNFMEGRENEKKHRAKLKLDLRR